MILFGYVCFQASPNKQATRNIIDRDIKEPLYLVRMQVTVNNRLTPGPRNQCRNHSCRDGRTGGPRPADPGAE